MNQCTPPPRAAGSVLTTMQRLVAALDSALCMTRVVSRISPDRLEVNTHLALCERAFFPIFPNGGVAKAPVSLPARGWSIARCGSVWSPWRTPRSSRCRLRLAPPTFGEHIARAPARTGAAGRVAGSDSDPVTLLSRAHGFNRRMGFSLAGRVSYSIRTSGRRCVADAGGRAGRNSSNPRHSAHGCRRGRAVAW